MENNNSFERIEEMEIEDIHTSFTPEKTKQNILDNLSYVRNSGAVVESFFSTTIKFFISLLGGNIDRK